MVECDLAKVEVASSNLVSRSKNFRRSKPEAARTETQEFPRAASTHKPEFKAQRSHRKPYNHGPAC